MVVREQLEAELRARWTPENLAVYGDYLQSEGDPLGELIVVGLRLEASNTSELRAHHERLLDQLGIKAPSLVKTGFVPKLRPSDFWLLDTPLGAHVRTVVIDSSRPAVRDALRELGRHKCPWLERIQLRVVSGPTRWGDIPSYPPDASERALVTSLASAAPHIRELEQTGAWFAGWSAAGELQSLAIDLKALLELARTTEAHDSVRTLELDVLWPVHGDLPDLSTASLAQQLPSLRALVVDRANMGDARLHAHVLRWLAETGHVGDLDLLVVPPPRTPNEVATLQLVRQRLSGRLEVARTYEALPAVDGVVVPPLRPWRPPDRENRRLTLVVMTKTSRYSPDVLDLGLLAATLDRLADAGPFALEPWQRFYAALGEPILAPELPLAALLDAIDTLPADLRGDIGAFAKRMRELPARIRATATVQVSLMPR